MLTLVPAGGALTLFHRPYLLTRRVAAHAPGACRVRDHHRHCSKVKQSGGGGQKRPADPGSPASGGATLSPPSTAPPVLETPAPGPDPLPEPLRLFSADSIFNAPIPAAAPAAVNSSGIVASFTQQIGSHGGKVVINAEQWSAPVYVVGPAAPLVPLLGESSICPRPEGVFSGFMAQIEAVPIPAGALPAAGTDKEVIVWQPSTGHLWELWRVLREGGHWTACWGGEIADAYTSDGVLPAPFGAGASGLSLLGGQIHLEDLQRGSIDHALEVSVPDTSSSGFVWPADRSDGTSGAADAIPEGTHLRLKPTLDLSALHLSPAALEIAKALQTYGMFVADTAGDVALQAQDPSPLIAEGNPNPYPALLGTDPYDVLNAIPWSELEVLSSAYRY